MRRAALFALALVVLLAVVGAVVVVSHSARVSRVFPADGATVATGSVEIRITFSRPIQPVEVQARVRLSPAVKGSWLVKGKTAVFTPAIPWRGGQTVVVEVAPPRYAGIPLGTTRRWQFRIAGTVLAYITPSDGLGDIFTINPKTGKISRLTQSDLVMDFSPDFGGRYVYFSQQNFQHGSDIWRIDRLQEGNPPKPKMLIKCGTDQCTSPKPDPTDSYIAYIRNDGFQHGPRVHVFAIATGKDEPLSSPKSTSRLPTWSPQGRLAYYDDGRGGYVIWQPDKGELQFWANDTGEADAWSPDGHFLVVVKFLLEGVSPNEAPSSAPYYSAHLWRYQIEPKRERLDITHDPNLEDGTPAFSPDGRWIACGRKYLDSKRWTPGRQFWLLKPDGSEARQITNAPDYNHLDFAWRPDSQAVAYARTNMTVFTEPPEIWLYDLKSGTNRLLVTDAVMPHWLP